MTSDEELLARALTDPAAFGTFYRRHAASVLAYLVRRSGSSEAGADLTAETFAAALARVETFDPARGEAVSWLFAIARNQLTDFQRRGVVARRARRKLGIATIALDDQALERVERLASLDVSATALGEALTELPEPQRDAVVARVLHELSYAEIGAAAEVSPAAARQRVARGLAALRHRLGGQP